MPNTHPQPKVRPAQKQDALEMFCRDCKDFADVAGGLCRLFGRWTNPKANMPECFVRRPDGNRD